VQEIRVFLSIRFLHHNMSSTATDNQARVDYLHTLLRAYCRLNDEVFGAILQVKFEDLDALLANPGTTDEDCQLALQKRQEWADVRDEIQKQTNLAKEYGRHIRDKTPSTMQDPRVVVEWLEPTEEGTLLVCQRMFKTTLDQCLKLDPAAEEEALSADVTDIWLWGSWEHVKLAVEPLVNLPTEELIRRFRSASPARE
jgi:hypothetical protein